MALTIQVETVARALADGVEDLLTRHWQEVALDQGSIPFAPDYDRIFQMERQGNFLAIVMRRDGRIIGYNAFVLTKHLHYRHTDFAVNDVIFVDKEERKGMAGVRLIRESERILRDRGAKKITYHSKLHVVLGSGKVHDTVGGLLRRLGYGHAESIYAKTL